jgi:hypothetical protein
VVRNCGFSEIFFFVVCDDIWIAIYPSFVVVNLFLLDLTSETDRLLSRFAKLLR